MTDRPGNRAGFLGAKLASTPTTEATERTDIGPCRKTDSKPVIAEMAAVGREAVSYAVSRLETAWDTGGAFASGSVGVKTGAVA